MITSADTRTCSPEEEYTGYIALEGSAGPAVHRTSSVQAHCVSRASRAAASALAGPRDRVLVEDGAGAGAGAGDGDGDGAWRREVRLRRIASTRSELPAARSGGDTTISRGWTISIHSLASDVALDRGAGTGVVVGGAGGTEWYIGVAFSKWRALASGWFAML